MYMCMYMHNYFCECSLYNTFQESRLYATKHMRVLLRLNAPFFISWGMEMLIGQLYDLSSDVADEAIDILDEACEEEVQYEK